MTSMNRKHTFAERRPRNSISRRPELAARAADLLDDGLGDGPVARQLSAEINETITARTVGSFRRASYAEIKAERQKRQDAAEKIRLIISAARGSGAIFTEAALDLLAKGLYDMLLTGAGDPLAIGKVLAKIGTVQNDTLKLHIVSDREKKEREAIAAATDETLSREQRESRAKQILGMSA